MTDQKATAIVAMWALTMWVVGGVIIFFVMGWKALLGIFLFTASYNIKWRK